MQVGTMSAAPGHSMNWDATKQSVKSTQMKGDLPEEVKRAIKRMLKEGDSVNILAGLSVRFPQPFSSPPACI